jgi:hypothetical protein
LIAEELASQPIISPFLTAVLDINATRGSNEAGTGMAGRTVVVRLNQQQLELLDRTIKRGEAPDRVSLIRKALREQAMKQRDGRAR